ncbi:MAG: SWIM zinc finger family protein [Planctomycetota bacterium]
MTGPRAQHSRRPATPRRVANGIRLAATEGAAAPPIARGWRDRLTAWFDEPALGEGHEYARTGQTVSLALEGHVVVAAVQGRAAAPYRTTIELPVFTREEWERVIEAMTAEAIYPARILAGELPAGVEDLFAELGLPLLPGGADAPTARCTCAAGGRCKHAAAVAWLLSQRLEREPLTILALRGLDASRLLEQLRQARAIRTRGVATAHADPLIAGSRSPGEPLESCLEDFWRIGPLPDDPLPRHAPHALLRRLGPSPLNGRFPLVGLLASIYDLVTTAANDLEERVDAGPGPSA